MYVRVNHFNQFHLSPESLKSYAIYAYGRKQCVVFPKANLAPQANVP